MTPAQEVIAQDIEDLKKEIADKEAELLRQDSHVRDLWKQQRDLEVRSKQAEQKMRALGSEKLRLEKELRSKLFTFYYMAKTEQ